MEANLGELLEKAEKEFEKELGKIAEIVVERILHARIKVSIYSEKLQSIKHLALAVKKYQNQHKYNNVVHPGEFKSIRFHLGKNGVFVYDGELSICRNHNKLIRSLELGKKYHSVLKCHKDYTAATKPVYTAEKTYAVDIITGKLEIPRF